MRIRPLALGLVTAAVAATVLAASPAQAVDSGPMKKCGTLAEIAKQVQVNANCEEGRAALTTFMTQGAKAAKAKGITCHWLAGDAKRVICIWDDKVRGGGSGAVLYADALIAASGSTSSK